MDIGLRRAFGALVGLTLASALVAAWPVDAALWRRALAEVAGGVGGLGPLAVAIPVAGVAAGVITTVGGMGGGMTLLLVLSLIAGPRAALTWTAPALLLGNLHRVMRYRAAVDRRLARALVVGGFLGSVLGALVVVRLPEAALRLGVAAMAMVALGKRMGWLRWRIAPRHVGPATFVNGAVCATSGGAGLLTAPLLMAAGLAGDAWIATNSVGAVAMHLGRLTGYSLGGAVASTDLALAGGLALMITAGNEVGVWLRRRLSAGLRARFETGVMATLLCVSLALLLSALAGGQGAM